MSKRLYIEYLSVCKNYHFATCKEGFIPIYCSYLPIYLMRIEMMMKRENSPWSWSLQDWIKRGEEPAFIGIRRVLETGAPCPCPSQCNASTKCPSQCNASTKCQREWKWGMPCAMGNASPPMQCFNQMPLPMQCFNQMPKGMEMGNALFQPCHGECLPPHARVQPCRGEWQWGMPNFPSCLRAIKEPPSQSKVSSSTAFNKSTPHLYYYYLGMKFLLIWLIVFISHINSFTIN